jgi:hypothetical protein
MDPDPGGPKTYGSYGSGSATMLDDKDKEQSFQYFGLYIAMFLSTITITVNKHVPSCKSLSISTVSAEHKG